MPSGKEVETVSSVRTGIALTPKTGTTTDDLLRIYDARKRSQRPSEVEESRQTKDG